MFEFLSKYPGIIYVDGQQIDNKDISEILNNKTSDCDIILKPNIETHKQQTQQYVIEVKDWMTRKSCKDFLFMQQWNNDEPMPLKVMQGELLQETRGMIRMKLHGISRNCDTCAKCGRVISNPISRLYGIGPECCDKLGILRDIREDEALKQLDIIRQRIENITWEGWVAKSAILNLEKVK